MTITEKRKNILELQHSEAFEFFLKNEHYCNFDLPPYILFDSVLKSVNSIFNNKKLSDLYEQSPKSEDDINHTILHNKDGKYSWRPIRIIHPVLYVSLVREITNEKNWQTICERFKTFKDESPNIKCMSVPIASIKNKKAKPEQILSWWENVEQRSIEMALDYEYLTHIDISNCYGSIYTHSVSWALLGIDEAKKKRNDTKLIGSIIDNHLRDMSYGQTNGIPQGSTLMDFIAEIILGYIDLELTVKTKKMKLTNYKIIRYRDDYRIFTNSLKDGEQIVKCISETLVKFGMSLNPNKTKPINQVIQGSIKSDKLYWIQEKQSMRSFQKHLLLIHSLSMKFPNSGSLVIALGNFYDRLKDKKNINNRDIYCLVSVIADIAYHSSRTYAVSSAIISKLLSSMKNKTKQIEIIGKIKSKFEKIPNTGHLDIWLQRIVIGFNANISFKEPICKIVNEPKKNNVSIWKSNWLKEKIRKEIKDSSIVNIEKLNKTKGEAIKRTEFEVFPIYQ